MQHHERCRIQASRIAGQDNLQDRFCGKRRKCVKEGNSARRDKLTDLAGQISKAH